VALTLESHPPMRSVWNTAGVGALSLDGGARSSPRIQGGKYVAHPRSSPFRAPLANLVLPAPRHLAEYGGIRGHAAIGIRGDASRHGACQPHRDGLCARRAAVRVPAGRATAGDQERRVARDSFSDRQRELVRRAGPAGRGVRPQLRQQRVRVRLLHHRKCADPQSRQSFHGERRESGRRGRRQRSAAPEPAELELGDQSQRLRNRSPRRSASSCGSTPTARFPATIPSYPRPPGSTRRSMPAACAIRSISRSIAATAASTSTTSARIPGKR
jgi:hypothetical protein